MEYAAVIGYPLGQSISPVFQQAALDHCGLAVRYERWETRAEELPQAVMRLRRPDHLGANVTVPHKEAVIPLLDGLEQTAAGIGAVNTIAKVDGRLRGHNTDAPAFLRSLREEGGMDPSGKRALVIGAGGSARAVVYALATAGAAFIGIAARNPDRARAVRQGLQAASKYNRVFVEEWGSEPLALAVPTYDLVVNCTPVGMRHGKDEERSPLGEVDISSNTFVYDLVYNPPETPLLKRAAAAGCLTLGGLPMLVYQGAAAFELWTGREAPLEVMKRAAEGALAGRDGEGGVSPDRRED